MSFQMKNAGIPLRRILVLEPYDISWLGVRQMLKIATGNGISLMRISETCQLADAVQCNPVDAVLLSAVGHQTEVLPLLHQLSLIMCSNKTLHITAYLRKELPHLKDLLQAFGVNSVFREPFDAADLVRHLLPTQQVFQPARFTRQECNVAQALLAGKSVTHVAQLMHRDVRTISAHKQSLLGKLNMARRGELQVLGGRLMAQEALV